jgi:hypothetical protein
MKKFYQAVLMASTAFCFSFSNSLVAQQSYTYVFSSAPFVSDPPSGATLEPIGIVTTPVNVTVPATTCPDMPVINLSHFENNAGLKARAFFTGTYSIEIIFKFDELDGYNRIIDFSNSASDYGIYTLGNCLNFYPTGNVGTCDFDTVNYKQLVITRNNVTKDMNVYVNGTLFTNHNDATDYYVIGAAPNDTIKFFRDDNVVPNEASSGNVAFIRMSDYELSSSDVAQSFSDFCSHITGIDETKNSAVVSVSPNPVHDKLNINISRADFSNGIKFDLVNVLGQKVFQTSIENESTSVDLKNLAPGIYFYQVDSHQACTEVSRSGVLKTGKIIIE